jgi:hypothetical protein
MRKTIFVNITLIIIITTTIFFVFYACKSIISDEFDEKTFKISEFDERVCELFLQALYDSNGVKVTDFVNVNLSSFKNIIDSTTLIQNTHNQIILNNFNHLLTILKPIEIEQLLVLRRDLSVLPKDDVVDTCYSKLNITSEKSNKFIIYTTWNFSEYDSLPGFNEKNYQDFIHYDIIKIDTSYIAKESGRPLESISGCVQEFELSTGGKEITPVIKGRQVYNLDSGDYIVRSVISSIDIKAFKLFIKSAE